MNIVIMDLGPDRREKDEHLKNLVSRLAPRPEVKLLLVCRESSPLAALAATYNIEVILCRGPLTARLKLGWRLRKTSSPWLMQCYDQKSLELAIRVASKKDHLNIAYAAMRPEAISDKQILDNLHLVGAVIADTREIADLMAANGFLQSGIFVIPASLDASPYLSRRVRQDDRIIFACSDTLEDGRGYEQLLEGMAYLLGYENMPGWEVRIASGGPMFDEFLAKAEERGVLARLSVFGGFPAPEILRDCDVMISPATAPSGGSLSVKEGWATGLAVICADIAGNRELLDNGENGLTFADQSPADLADKMYSLASDRDLRAALARAGTSSLREYSPEAVLQAHLAIYKKFFGQEARLDSLQI